MDSHLIKPRWIDIPEDAIFQQLLKVGLNTWELKTLFVNKSPRYYLFGGNYAYPYSLPADAISRLATRLNEVYMTWYRDYNTAAMDYFADHGVALNQAAEYWTEVGNTELPRPEILELDGLANGDEYIAIIGLFHLLGWQNRNNHHLFIDLIDLQGNRIYDHVPPLLLFSGWDGMTTDQVRETKPIRIDKPPNEPGANLGMEWNQVIYGFHINNIGTDRFKGIHIRYEDDGEGNDRGHHSHYIVLQKRVFQSGSPPDPDPDPDPPTDGAAMMIKKSWIDEQPVDDDGYIRIKE